jgi:histidinol-phosphate aminotransferase
LRVGYTVAPPKVAAAVRKTALPFGVTSIAERAAIASLDARGELLDRVATLVEERQRMSEALRSLGLPVADSQANFVWLPLGARAADFAAACRANDVLVRAFPGQGVRITVGEVAGNDIVLSVAATFSG